MRVTCLFIVLTIVGCDRTWGVRHHASAPTLTHAQLIQRLESLPESDPWTSPRRTSGGTRYYMFGDISVAVPAGSNRLLFEYNRMGYPDAEDQSKVPAIRDELIRAYSLVRTKIPSLPETDSIQIHYHRVKEPD